MTASAMSDQGIYDGNKPVDLLICCQLIWSSRPSGSGGGAAAAAFVYEFIMISLDGNTNREKTHLRDTIGDVLSAELHLRDADKAAL